jgi:hypothetical protein
MAPTNHTDHPATPKNGSEGTKKVGKEQTKEVQKLPDDSPSTSTALNDRSTSVKPTAASPTASDEELEGVRRMRKEETKGVCTVPTDSAKSSPSQTCTIYNHSILPKPTAAPPIPSTKMSQEVSRVEIRKIEDVRKTSDNLTNDNPLW